MSSNYKYQEQFATDLAAAWLDGKQEHVRTIIRNLKNKAQAAYIAARVAIELDAKSPDQAEAFVAFLHPNEQ